MALLTANVRSCPWAGKKERIHCSQQKSIEIPRLSCSYVAYIVVVFQVWLDWIKEWNIYALVCVCVHEDSLHAKDDVRAASVCSSCCCCCSLAELSWAEWKRDEPGTPSALFNVLPSDRRPASSSAPLPHRFEKERRRGSQKAHITATTTTWTNNARPQLRNTPCYIHPSYIPAASYVVRRHFGSWQKKKAFVALLREYSCSKENDKISTNLSTKLFEENSPILS